MERNGERMKSKSSNSPEKLSRMSHRHSRRRRKSSSSSSDDEPEARSASTRVKTDSISDRSHSVTPDCKTNVPEPPAKQDPVPAGVVKNDTDSKSESGVLDGVKSKYTAIGSGEWKEDNSFWETDEKNDDHSGAAVATASPAGEEKRKDSKDAGEVWKVQSANGSTGKCGEIQKLKICRQRLTESPEFPKDTPPRRLSRRLKDSSSSSYNEDDEPAAEEGGKRTERETSSSSSPSLLVHEALNVICETESPTKIKIINDENDDKSSKSKEGNVEKSPSSFSEKAKQESSESMEFKKGESVESTGKEKKEKSKSTLVNNEEEKQVRRSSSSKSLSNEREERRSIKKSSSPNPRRERKHCHSSSSSSSSSDDSSSSSDSDSSHSRKKNSKSKRHDGKTSSVYTEHPKKVASDLEDDRHHQKGKPAPSQEGQLDRTYSANSNMQNLVTNSKPASEGDCGGTGATDQGGAVVTRKRRWGASKTIRPVKKPVLSISTDSLKNIIPGVKPIPAEELQLSVEEEEGLLDNYEIVEVAHQVEEESTRKKDRKHEKEERRKEHKEKELEHRKKYNENKDFKPEQPSTSGSDNQKGKGSSSRKILLITDDARKRAHSPSPRCRHPSNVLFITNLMRPFTAQQLKNLLLRTGTIAENGFWIDKIKSKCYVKYITEDAAVETRHALHGSRWPVNSPKTLVVKFASHDDMAVAQLSEETDLIPCKAEPLVIDRSVGGWTADQARLKAQGDRANRRVMAAIREWDVSKPEHPDEIIEQEHRAREQQREQERRIHKERSHRRMTLEINELPGPMDNSQARKQRRKKHDARVKLLDELFNNTKTSPCIYWLPLTAKQIAVKEKMRRQYIAKHKLRVAEMEKAEQARHEH